MKKLKLFIFILLILFLSGCAVEVELPPEGTRCSWYINDTYETSSNANWLFYEMEDMINLDENPSVNFWYNGVDDYGVNFTGLTSDADVEIYDDIVDSGTYEVLVCSDHCVRLAFNFDENNIKQSTGVGNCPYPTLYYQEDTTEVTKTYDFSTGISTEQKAFINIYNSLENVKPDDPDNPEEEPEEEINWCSTYYHIEDTSFDNDANLILYFWKTDDGIVYAVDRIASDIELTNENVGDYSTFSYNYSWQSIEDDLDYWDFTSDTVFVSAQFNAVKNMITEDEDGKLICPDGYEQETTSGATTGVYDGEELVVITGEEFKRRLRELEPYMQSLATYKNIYISGKLPVKINGTDTNFKWFNVGAITGVENVQLEYLTEQKIANVVDYCNSFYDDADKNKNKQNFDLRMEECISFNEMLEEATHLGLIRDLKSNCDIISNELVDKLKWFLDIVKIAGPLLALGLGTLDFIKTVASGDADKEMKNTFKKFGTRLIAAALLFLVPFILAFLMDLFLGNQNGYNSDDPFCGIVEWSDYNDN